LAFASAFTAFSAARFALFIAFATRFFTVVLGPPED